MEMRLVRVRRRACVEWFAYGIELGGLALTVRAWWVGDLGTMLLGMVCVYRGVELDKEAKADYGPLYRRDQ